MFKNRTLMILALIMLVNALAYGTIIPLMYPYASRFGIGPFLLSLLFMSFSIAQFIATPIIGRLSDKYGRKPLLVISLAGTSLSLAMFALATSIPMLFFARILDGITGGNMSVAQAVIADSTSGADRAKSMGILGAAFGFGFLFGPALGGLLSRFGLTAPFWFAAALGLVATVLITFFLPETLKKGVQKEAQKEKFFDPKALLVALSTPVVGTIFLITLLSSIAQNAFIIGFQSYAFDFLHLDATSIGLQFSLYGLIGIIMQSVGIGFLLKRTSTKRHILQGSLLLSTVAMVLLFLQRNFMFFTLSNIVYAFVSAPLFVLAAGMISERTHKEDQGATLGLNQSYMSLGQIIGPLMAGLASNVSIPSVFGLAGVFYLISWATSLMLKARTKQVDI